MKTKMMLAASALALSLGGLIGGGAVTPANWDWAASTANWDWAASTANWDWAASTANWDWADSSDEASDWV